MIKLYIFLYKLREIFNNFIEGIRLVLILSFNNRWLVLKIE